MIIRAYQPTDLEVVKEIHKKHFGDEYELPDLMKQICTFVAEDDQGIISVGMVRNIAEVLTVTNKSRSNGVKGRALLKTLEVSSYIAEKAGHNQLHAFVQDANWAQQLIKHGFRPTQGQALVRDIDG